MVLTVIPASFVICIVIGRLCDSLAANRFHDKWPPIDDDEFVRRCPPGTRRKTALGVRRIVSEQLGIDYNRVYPE